MTKQEIINKLKLEFEFHKNESNICWSEGFTHLSANHVGRAIQIRDIIEDLKQLNEATVKRSELIDFLNYQKKLGIVSLFDDDILVESYLKSINSNGA